MAQISTDSDCLLERFLNFNVPQLLRKGIAHDQPPAQMPGPPQGPAVSQTPKLDVPKERKGSATTTWASDNLKHVYIEAKEKELSLNQDFIRFKELVVSKDVTQYNHLQDFDKSSLYNRLASEKPGGEADVA
jgi:hypothetical protein